MSQYNIPLYPGIGDNPIPPTVVSHGNADYFIDKFNNFVDHVLVDVSNDMTTQLTSLLIIYIDSEGGNDVTGNGSSLSPYLTIDRVVKHLDDLDTGLGVGSELVLRLSGIFENINLSNIPIVNNTRRAKITIEGDFVLELSDKDIKLNPSGFYEIKQGICLLTGANSISGVKVKLSNGLKLNFNTNSTKLYINNCDLEMDNVEVTNNFVNNPIDITNTILTLKNITLFTAEANGSIIELGVGVMAFLNTLVCIYEDIEKLTLIRGNYGSRIYLDNVQQLTSLRINYGGMAYQDIFYSNIQDRANYIVNLLNSLPNENKLPLSSIKQYEDIILPTPDSIKNQLGTLTGDDRLDSSKIKNLDNYNTFSTLTEEFTQPSENSQVTITMGDTRWLQSGVYIKISGGGIYLVLTITDSEHIIIKNTGDISNVNEGTVIASGGVITLTGKSGYRGFSTTTSPLQHPAVGESLLVSLSNADSIITNSIIHIDGSDYYRVESIIRLSQQVNCKRLGYILDIEVGTNIASGARVIVAGVQGIAGNGAFCYLTELFVVPEIRQNVTIKVSNSDFLVEGNWIFIYEVGYFEVIDVVDDLTIIIKNIGVTDNLPPGAEIYSPRKIINSSKHGESSFSKTRGVYLVPIVGESNAVFVDIVSWMVVGFKVLFNNSYYEITSIDVYSKTVFLKNLSDISIGTSVAEDSLIVLAGEEGDKGDKGDTGNFFTTVTETFDTPDVGGTISIVIESSSLFLEDMYIYIESSGVFQIKSIIDDNNIIVSNFNGLENFTVNVGDKINVYGVPNLEVINTLPFIQPEINGSVLVETLQPTTYFHPNSFCFIFGAGYYLIESVGSYSMLLKNNYHQYNVIPGTNIEDSNVKSVLGLPEHKVFKLSEEIIQPEYGQVVSTKFYNFRFLTIGETLRSPNNGFYFVESISTINEEVFLKNLGYGYSDEKLSGESILDGELFFITPPRGETSFNSNVTFTTESFLQPSIGDSVTILVQDTGFLIEGQYIVIENAGANYKIVSVNSKIEIEILNIGRSNVAVNSVIPTQSKVSTSGAVDSLELEIHKLKGINSSYNYNLLNPIY